MYTPAISFRVDLGRDAAVGPGKIALLEHIARGGSLSQAARDLHMSYRRAWQLLDDLNGCFRQRVALTAKGGRGGGGATLTAFGRQLVRIYRQFPLRRHRAVRARHPRQGRSIRSGHR